MKVERVYCSLCECVRCVCVFECACVLGVGGRVC